MKPTIKFVRNQSGQSEGCYIKLDKGKVAKTIIRGSDRHAATSKQFILDLNASGKVIGIEVWWI